MMNMMTEMKLTPAARELYESGKYELSLAGDQLRVAPGRAAKMTAAQLKKAVATDRPLLAEIKAALLAEREEARRQAAERQARIDAIPGLKEIRALIEARADWRDELTRQMDSEDGCTSMPGYPEGDIKALCAQYPRAAAYLRAEAWAEAENDVKSQAGAEALEKILNGEPHEEALAEMEQTWQAHVRSRMWD